MDCGTPHDSAKVRECGTPGLIVGAVVPDRAQQDVPLCLPWVDDFTLGPPGYVPLFSALILVDPGSGRVNVAREFSCALGAVDKSPKVIVAIRYVPTRYQRLGAIRKGVLDRVTVKILAAIGATGESPPYAVGRDRIGILDPRTFKMPGNELYKELLTN